MAKAPPQKRVHVLDDLEQIRILADPLRLRILEVFGESEHTTLQVAHILGEKPTKLYYHVDQLEKIGVIELVRTQAKRGTLEKYYRAIAKSFRTSPEAFSRPGSAEGIGANVLASASSDLATLDVGHLGEDDRAIVLGARLKVRLERIHWLAEELQRLLEQVEAFGEGEEEAEVEADYRLAVALFPLRPTPPDED